MAPKREAGLKRPRSTGVEAGEVLQDNAGLNGGKTDLTSCLTLLAEHCDWGKTGDRSSRDDSYAVFAVGPKGKNLVAHVAYNLDGPEYGETDSDNEDGDEDYESPEPKMTVSFQIGVYQVPAASTTSSAANDHWIQGLLHEKGTQQLVSLDLSGGKVIATKFEHCAGALFMKAAGAAKDFTIVVAEAIRAVAAKNQHLKPLKACLLRRRGVDNLAAPLVNAFRALPVGARRARIME